MPEMNYTLFETGEIGGGFSNLGEDGGLKVAPGDVLIYVGSEDIESDLKKAEGLGGKTLVPKMEIPEKRRDPACKTEIRVSTARATFPRASSLAIKA